MKKKIMAVISIAVPLLVGFISSMISRDAMKQFDTFKKPPLAPPPILFPIAWTILYISMGLALYLALCKINDTATKTATLTLYIVQLIVNFFWSIIFFNLDLKLLAFIVLLILLFLVICLATMYKKHSFIAFIMTIPYIAWLVFAGYLNISIVLLN